MDGISRFGGGGADVIEFRNEMAEFQAQQLEFQTMKMKEEFKDKVKEQVEMFNEMLAGQDEGYAGWAEDLLSGSLFTKGGNNQWARYDVTVDATIWGDQKQNQALTGYRPKVLSLNLAEYLKDDVVALIDGHQTVYRMLLDQTIENARNGYDAYAKQLETHFGGKEYTPPNGAMAEFYSETSYVKEDASLGDRITALFGSPTPTKEIKSAFTVGGGEMYRLTWAASYYNAMRQAGWDKQNTPFYDRPLWDTDGDNDGATDKGAWSMSLFDTLKIGTSVVLAATGVGAIAAAAINTGLAMAHDTLNYATGYMSEGEWGISMIKNAVGFATSAFTAGIGTSFLEDAASDWAINTAGSLATSGLRTGANGEIVWAMDKQQFASFGVNAVAGLGKSLISSSFSDKFGGGGTFGDKVLYGMSEWGVGAAGDFVNKGWKVNNQGNLDWSMTGNEANEALMDMTTSGLNSFISIGLEGYGSSKRESFLSYGLTKGLSTLKYDLYKSGFLGTDIANKYAGKNSLDLAGGIDLSLFSIGGDKDNKSYKFDLGFSSLNGIHEGAGEFGGMNISYNQESGWGWKGAETMYQTIMNIRDISSTVGSAANWVGNQVGSAANAIGNLFTQNSSESRPYGNPADRNNDVHDITNVALLRREDDYYSDDGYVAGHGREDSPVYASANVKGDWGEGLKETMKNLTAEDNDRLTALYYEKNPDKIGQPVSSGDLNNFRKEINYQINPGTLAYDKQIINDGNVQITNMSEDVYNKVMDYAVKSDVEKFFSSIWTSIFDADTSKVIFDKAIDSTIVKMSNLNKLAMNMQNDFGIGLGKDNKVLNLKELVELGKPLVFGEANKGSHYQIPLGGWKDKAPEGMETDRYDDLFTVIAKQKDAKGNTMYSMGEFYRGNMDPSNWDPNKPKLGVSTELHGQLGPGIFDLGFYHREDGVDKNGKVIPRDYDALRVFDKWNMDGDKDIYTLPDYDKYNPKNGGEPYLRGVLFHPGNKERWTRSEGCQTIHSADYEHFINYFRFGTYADDGGGNGIYFSYKPWH
ncbi:MAG: hypothetical protein HPY53_13345 [Brevinematales bacterium]|nr:hypothetical protein [Brevinematales bacterium]